jgi:AraC family transcriptional regulator
MVQYKYVVGLCMLKPYDLLASILSEIEKNIKKGINIPVLEKEFLLSERHLRRLFKFAFNQPLANYIRSRKLSSSLNDLLQTDANIFDIALDYGFSYEQTYIRAFKDEFGISPGELRKTGKIVKIKPPLHLFDHNKISNGVLFGPDIVIVPKFQIVGTSHSIPFNDPDSLMPKAALHFWENDCKYVKKNCQS